MEKIVLNPVEIVLDVKAFAMSKKMEVHTEVFKEALKFEKAAQEIVRPKAVLKWCAVSNLKEESIQVDQTKFTSRLLSKKLKNTERVFAAVITAGNDLDNLALPEEAVRNLLKYATLNAARNAVDGMLKEKFGFHKIAKLNPGSLPDWPILNNRSLFKIIGDVKESTGVVLTDKNYMEPGYTVSELIFATDEDYENCSLCKKLDCIGRKTPFSPKAYDDIFGEPKA